MNAAEAKSISINDFLQQAGHTVVKTTAKNFKYLSPFRDEKEPSFHVTKDGRGWKDFGDGRGGNIIDLAYRMSSGLPLPTRLSGEQVKEAVAYIERIVGTTISYRLPPVTQRSSMTYESAYRVVSHKPFSVYGRGSYLTKSAVYLGERGINAERFAPYLEDVTYTGDDDKPRYGFGMENISGGFELRRLGDWQKIAVGGKNVTFFKSNRDEWWQAPWHCFYSMIDFGTFLTVDKPPIGTYNYLIINSDSLVGYREAGSERPEVKGVAERFIETVPVPGWMVHYPHNDASGQRAYHSLLEFLNCLDWGAGDRAHLYEGSKDWTEAREKQLGLDNKLVRAVTSHRDTPKFGE